jgi:hypothetical protein
MIISVPITKTLLALFTTSRGQGRSKELQRNTEQQLWKRARFQQQQQGHESARTLARIVVVAF